VCGSGNNGLSWWRKSGFESCRDGPCLNAPAFTHHNEKNLEGTGMDSINFQASHRNKKFIVSIMDALARLNADEFINLFLQADNSAVYKVTKEDKDAHTKLLTEVFYNIRYMNFFKEQAEIILQAMYAAPKMTNLGKVMAMMAVGSVFEHEEFVRLFGEGGDFSFDKNQPRSYSYQEDLHLVRESFRTGRFQSRDPRFLIDKLNVVESAFSTDAVESFFGSLNQVDFTEDAFIQLLSSRPEQQKSHLMTYAPSSLFGSPKVLDLLDKGYVPHHGNMHVILENAFKSEDAPSVVKVAQIILDQSYQSNGYEQLTYTLHQLMSSELTEKQSEIRNELISLFDKYELSVAERNDREFHRSAPHYLMRAFDRGNLEHFTKILKASSKYVHSRDYHMSVFMEMTADAKSGMLITEDHKIMLFMLKDSIVDQLNDLTNSIKVWSEKTESVGRMCRRSEDRTGPGF
jgi:hypothetical protein